MKDASVPKKTAIVIVTFRTPADLVHCLDALRKADRAEPFDIFITENAGGGAYDDTLEALRRGGYVFAPAPEPVGENSFVRLSSCRDEASGVEIHFGQARENLGYAGAINIWLRRLMADGKWKGFWILNPDTAPDESALRELVAYARRHDKGMVGSRIVFRDNPELIATRGLKWRPLAAKTKGVDKFVSAKFHPDRLDIEARIDSPSGASVFITAGCLKKIGLMDEDYFLYFEDLDWGVRAKSACGIGCAERSNVPHIGGASIGSATSRRDRSALSVHLDHRNRLLFVRRRHPRWYPWTVLIVLARTGEFVAVGAWANFRAALSGWAAGVLGETGRPDRFFARRQL